MKLSFSNSVLKLYYMLCDSCKTISLGERIHTPIMMCSAFRNFFSKLDRVAMLIEIPS